MAGLGCSVNADHSGADCTFAVGGAVWRFGYSAVSQSVKHGLSSVWLAACITVYAYMLASHVVKPLIVVDPERYIPVIPIFVTVVCCHGILS